MADDIVDRLQAELARTAWTPIVTPTTVDAGLLRDARDEIGRLRAEASRSCMDCASGVARQRNEPGEVVVSCRGPLRGNAFLMPFFCSRWEERSEH